ncbi:MAG: pitrilysin family protein [Rikenellaceae bacterium]
MAEFYTYQLPNGIRGIHRRTPGSVTHCALLINAGSRDELKGESGLAHFTEHALFKGTAKRHAYQVNCRLENLGGELNAFTTKEDTTIHATTLRGDFSKAVELISDIVFNSTFPQKELEREREIVLDEINTYKDSPSELIYDSFEEMLFKGSELGCNILGRKSDIKRFDTEAIKRFTTRCYTTDEMVFSTIGNLSPSRVEAIAARYFGDIPQSHREFQRAEATLLSPFDVSEKHRTHQVHTMIGTRAYGINESKRLPFALLVNLLGGPSANSLLNLEIRERYALTYNIEANYTPYTDCGVFSIYFGADGSNTERAMELINEQLHRLQNEPLTPRRLSMAKRQFIAQLEISMESNEGYMLGVGKSFLLHNSVDTTQQIEEKVRRLTADDIMEVAQERFNSLSMLTYK